MKRILIMLLAASLVFSFVACSEKEEEEKKESVNYEEKMAESVSVDSTQIIDGEEGALKVSATVTLPDFDSFFNECINETKERAKNDEDFNKKLLRALYQKTRRSETSVTKEYEIDLTKAETEEWSDADIEEYIKKYAVEKEIEAYCMRVVLLEAPDIEE